MQQERMIRAWMEQQQRMVQALMMPGPQDLTNIQTLQGGRRERGGAITS